MSGIPNTRQQLAPAQFVAVDSCGCPIAAIEEDPHVPNADVARYVLANGDRGILLAWRRREVKVLRVVHEVYVRDYSQRIGTCTHGGRS